MLLSKTRIGLESSFFGLDLAMYIIRFDTRRKIPHWSMSWHDGLYDIKPFPRLETFYQQNCKELPSKLQGGQGQYSKGGYDRGHLTPANPFRFTYQASVVINQYTNIAPQEKHINRNAWKIFELFVEKEMNRLEGIVTTGVCKATIDHSLRLAKGVKRGLDVPKCFWKWICYVPAGESQPVGMAFYSDNSFIEDKDLLTEEPKRKKEISTPHTLQWLNQKESGIFSTMLDPRIMPNLLQGRFAPFLFKAFSSNLRNRRFKKPPRPFFLQVMLL